MSNSRIYILRPQGLLDTEQRVMQHDGKEVHKIQPRGCPRNGTMGQCYVQVADTGEFIGLVNQTSLVKTNKTAPVRDLAAEAREARSQAIRDRYRNLRSSGERDENHRSLRGRL